MGFLKIIALIVSASVLSNYGYDSASVCPEQNHYCDLSRRVKTDFPFNPFAANFSKFLICCLLFLPFDPSTELRTGTNFLCNKLLRKFSSGRTDWGEDLFIKEGIVFSFGIKNY